MGNMKYRKFTLCLLVLLMLQVCWADKKSSKKYSREANEKPEKQNWKDAGDPAAKNSKFESVMNENYDVDFRNLQRPFRMAKLNLVWTKAQSRLTEPKLKSLYLELKIHDKEEIAWKQLNSQHKDKDGLKENELRQKLIGIMSTYDLLEHFEDAHDKEKTKPYKKFHDTEERQMNKNLFKDKKLNKLWEKAEISGFTAEELESLKQEFHHHQDKVDVYYSLLEDIGNVDTAKHENAINEDELENFNMVDKNDNEIQTPQAQLKKYENNINALRDHHRGIKDQYDRLERLISSGPHSQDFIEPKVQGLWRVALASNFSEKELSSIKSELHHFESRLLKLRHLQAEQALQKEKYKNDKHKDKTSNMEEMEITIKKQTRKLEKIQETIESTIFKHTEL